MQRPAVRPAKAPRSWRGVVLGTATPQRLGRLSALLVVGCLLTALVSALAGGARADAVGAGGTRLAALDTDAGQLYRSLNEAEAMATSGFAADGPVPRTVRARYDDHVTRATQRLAHVASLLPPGGHDAALVEQVASRLPRYAALVEAAGTLRGEGSPRAQEPLDQASALMRDTILPAADELRRGREAALATNYRQAGEFPLTVVVVGTLTLLGVGYAALRERRRTNRILNPGLVVAAGLLAVALVWWLVATVAAADRLEAARGHNTVAAALDEARVSALQARASETLARVDGGSDAEFTARIELLLGGDGLLDTAGSHTTDAATASGIATVRAAATEWRDGVRAGAGPDETRSAFDRLTAALADVIGAERTDLAGEVRAADAVLRGTAAGPALVALLAAAGAAFGISRRIREYR
ncbi:hypothetical protein CFP66_03130 [Pseudonocardia sp. MH-G8]|nr:hypothetical protein CFP66_03130 [Pseudonocardia sp. MH-G8]